MELQKQAVSIHSSVLGNVHPASRSWASAFATTNFQDKHSTAAKQMSSSDRPPQQAPYMKPGIGKRTDEEML